MGTAAAAAVAPLAADDAASGGRDGDGGLGDITHALLNELLSDCEVGLAACEPECDDDRIESRVESRLCTSRDAPMSASSSDGSSAAC